MSGDTRRFKAIQMLILANVFWGLSFPTTKALMMAQQALLPAGGTLFIASLCTVYRFAAAALVLLLLSARTFTKPTRLEIEQGLGLGFFAGAGILLQVDGLAYTSASTSAFLTQCYVLIIPLWVAWRERRRPPVKIFLSCLLVIFGIAVLARVDWQNFRLGRGELETIAASIIFTGQILWLERPRYAGNNVRHFSIVMFAVMSLVSLPVAWFSTENAGDWFHVYNSMSVLGFMAILVCLCTFGGYLLMNQWQRHLAATEAGLIYCLEPVFASVFALFLPAMFSTWAAVEYPNEQLTGNLLVGGGLITAANMMIQLPSRTTIRVAVAGNDTVPIRPENRPVG